MTHLGLPEIDAKNRYQKNRHRFPTRLTCNSVANFSGVRVVQSRWIWHGAVW